MRTHHSFLLAVILVSNGAWAQEWTPRFDLLTAGAAASVIMTHICSGSEAAKQAAQSASRRLQEEANDMASYGVDPAKAYEYSSDSYSMKIKAMWQANATLGCSDLERLKNIAQYTGFSTP